MPAFGSWFRFSIFMSFLAVVAAGAQDADPLPTKKDTVKFPNTIAGEFTPGSGFDIIKTTKGSLNVSVYGLFRYINQLPAEQSFTDHQGVVRSITTVNDLNWHRTMIWFTGFFYDPKFRYNITAWGLATTQQTLLFGNLQYTAASWFTVGVGIAPNLTSRSMQGSWPFWAGSDRQMAEEFFRGGFSSGMFITGFITPKLTYNLTVDNNLSQLGVVQANDTRDLSYTASLRWQPTTGEFGFRNGFGDFEHHEKVATQFGVSGGKAREGRYAPVDQPPNETQIKLSDSTSPFALGALVQDVTVTALNYSEMAFDAGVKYRGFSFQSEYYLRDLNHFIADAPLPDTLGTIFDNGFFAEAGYMAVPKTLNVYVVGSYIWDQFKRRPWEIGGGADYYPGRSRSWRVNLHLLHVYKSPASSFFGYYAGGMTGTVFSLGCDVLF
jgi:hypothetical protein